MSPLFSFSNLKIQFSGLTFILNKRLRIWATQKLREFIVKGFVLDDERLKNPDQPFDYFEELLPNPNGIESISPGLRGMSYPGWTKMEFTTPTGLQQTNEARGCNPFRVGKVRFTVSQGSSCRATLGWMTESRWDSRTDAPLFTQIATIGLKIQNLRQTSDLLLPGDCSLKL